MNTPPPAPSCDGIEVSLGTGGTKCVVPSSGKSFKDCPECPEMVVAPAGQFMMGSPESEEGRGSDEGPLHEVTISTPFAVGKFEVTFTEWDACVAAGGCKHDPEDRAWGRGDRPVIAVSWDDITNEYLPWLSSKTSKSYRLLTESEWEYAARAGARTRFSFGDSDSELDDYGWYSSNSSSKTQPVGQKKPNSWGLYDVHGNVWEWVQDCYADSYRDVPRDGSPAKETSGCARVLRGGSWFDSPPWLRSAFRGRSTPDIRSYSLGFRVARTL